MGAERLVSSPGFGIFDQTSVTEENRTLRALFGINRHLEADQAPHNIRQTLVVVLISDLCSGPSDRQLLALFLLLFLGESKLRFGLCFGILLVCAGPSRLLLLLARGLHWLVNWNDIRLYSKFFQK